MSGRSPWPHRLLLDLGISGSRASSSFFWQPPCVQKIVYFLILTLYLKNYLFRLLCVLPVDKHVENKNRITHPEDRQNKTG